MPAAAQPPIIDLTEIVEKKAASPQTGPEDELSGYVSDLMKKNGEGDDIELDDLLAQLNDDDQNQAASSDPAINPHERLNMPGMDDMDAMLREFDAGGAARTAAKANPPDPELDDLLAELGTPDKSAPDKPAPDTAKAPPKAAPGSSHDAELDDLLAGLDADPKVPADADAAKAPADVDLDDLLAGLDDAGSAPARPAAKPAARPSVDDELDALLDAAPPRAASAPSRSANADEMLNNLLDGLDVPPSGPVDRPAAAPADAERATRRLDALLDSAPRQSPPQEGDAALETGLVLELRELVGQLRERLEHTAAEALDTREEQERLRQDVDDLRERLGPVADDAPGTGGQAADLHVRLEALEGRCGDIAGELAALRERLAPLETKLAEQTVSLDTEQLNGIAERVVSAMRPEIEREAAASAARVIREEISALFAES